VRLGALLRTCHPAPALAVTVLTALLAVGDTLSLGRGVLVTAAVGTGQLSIGWSNDLVDLARDREVGRLDKPLVGGELSEALVRGATAVAVAASVVLSMACGPASAVVNLVLGVGAGWAYNLGLKGTVWSFVPYVAAFGTLPAVVSLADADPHVPPAWVMVASALLGVGAHLLNVLPDLADDERTGVRGLPHRLGARRVRVLAPLLLLVASAVILLGPGVGPAWPWVVLAAVAAMAGLAMTDGATGRGRRPFLLAIAIALVDVVALVLRR
jgi:4-hydroxybenzoate polyprenyltransferase